MSDIFAPTGEGLALKLVSKADAARLVDALPAGLKPLAAGFTGQAGQIVLWPSDSDSAAWLGIGEGKDVFALGAAARKLPEGDWAIEALPEDWDETLAMTAWGLGGYGFTAFKKADRKPARLVPPKGADADEDGRTQTDVSDADGRTRTGASVPVQDSSRNIFDHAPFFFD